jgi:uncharacterized membrane protein YraQ (UPF0718 family)
VQNNFFELHILIKSSMTMAAQTAYIHINLSIHPYCVITVFFCSLLMVIIPEKFVLSNPGGFLLI